MPVTTKSLIKLLERKTADKKSHHKYVSTCCSRLLVYIQGRPSGIQFCQTKLYWYKEEITRQISIYIIT